MPIVRTAIGLMSGTSLDGIDAAIIKTDGHKVELTDYFVTVPYKQEFRERIRKYFGRITDLGDIERDITLAHESAVKLLLEEAKMHPGDVDVIGFHGQTIFHDPDNGVTKQIGDGALLAKLTGINVVNDFRSNDMKLGGQGAPLVPLFHFALFQDREKPIAAINIGGVSNITYIPGDDENEIVAFDTGPGNALIDDWMLKHYGRPYDDGGQVAASGEVNEQMLFALLSHKYFDKRPPKSLDRDSFSSRPLSSLTPEDGAATLAAFTAQSIVKSVNHLKKEPISWVILGGGRHNKFIMKQLSESLQDNVYTAEDWGINGDAIEAQAFAYLAVRSIEGLPLSLPLTTGVKYAATGGVFCPA